MPGRGSVSDFRRLVYHVQEGCLVHLLRELKREHFYPEASKLNVTFGPDARPNDYFCCSSVAQVWFNDFDFHQFFDLDCKQKDELILKHLAAALVDVANRQGVAHGAVDRAFVKAESEGLLLRYAIHRLSRIHPCRKLKFNVVRSIERGSESWFLDVSDREDNVLDSFVIVEKTYAILAGNAYRKSRWRGDTFLLTDSRGRIKYQKSTKQIVKRYVG